MHGLSGVELGTIDAGAVEAPRRADDRYRDGVRECARLGAAFMAERDPAALFQRILTGARSLISSTTASLYLVERDGTGARGLRFIGSDADSLPDAATRTFCLPLDATSIAGHVAATAQPLIVDDLSNPPGDVPWTWDADAFARHYGFRATSALAVPMLDRRNRVCGVLQLVDNSMDRGARDVGGSVRGRLGGYTTLEVELVSALGYQAAAAIENRRAFEQAEKLFEGFVRAFVDAVDGRVPATAGHSARVTELTCSLARVMDRRTAGPFADTYFPPDRLRQLRFACLLHDVGNLGVATTLLDKRRKLPTVVAERIADRFELIRTRKRLAAAEGFGDRLEEELAREYGLEGDLARLDEFERIVREADVPGPPSAEVVDGLEQIAAERWTDSAGEVRPLLTEEELRFLEIGHGSLGEGERRSVEAHVDVAHRALRDVPWTPDLARVAEIVRGHHEKLDGSGYPDGVRGERLLLESRMLAVCDIFDALTATDRPYGKAMVVTDALLVLEQEAREGKLDARIVDLFVESEVHREVMRRRRSDPGTVAATPG